MRSYLLLFPCLVLLLAAARAQAVADVDSDGDGLSDFREVHKHFTNPKKTDSDGDGIPDGDWRERREYQYTVRTVVQVMRPVTPEFLTDDYQDVRVLDETPTFVELEVIHYPFNTVESAIHGDRSWRRGAAKMREWTKPGATADWNPSMQKELLSALRADGIDVRKLDDKTAVERVSDWLLKRAKYHDGFSTFITAFDDKGRPYIPEELDGAANGGQREKGLTLEEQWRREISARGMFETKARGSCSSSAIYLNGCLRAVGVPTRIVLCIPLVDANDPRELELVHRGIRHNEVRRVLEAKLRALRGKWASHTFNEVWVGGRWRRLNYSHLGQNIYDKQFFGLMTHVATFRDWADAKMPETIGRFAKTKRVHDVFGGPNPYSAIAVRDEFGKHCRLDNPPRGVERVKVAELQWTDSEKLPAAIRESCKRKGRFGLIARLTDLSGSDALRAFLEGADNRVFLEADGRPTLKVGFEPGCWWYDNGRAWIYVPFGGADRRDLVTGVEYAFVPRNSEDDFVWVVPAGMTVTRR